jgi:hypothetical protein
MTTSTTAISSKDGKHILITVNDITNILFFVHNSDGSVAGVSDITLNNGIEIFAFDGTSFISSVLVGQYSQSASALAIYKGIFYLGFLSLDTHNRILICTSPDGVAWSTNNYPVDGQSGQNQLAPSLAQSNSQGKLWVAFISNDTHDRILVCSSPTGLGNWSDDVAVQGQSGSGSPSLVAVFDDPLAAFNNKLWVSFISNDTHNRILVCYSEDGGNNWIGNYALHGQSSQSTPSLLSYHHKLWIAFISNDTHNRVLICNSEDGKNWSRDMIVSTSVAQQGESSSASPTLLVFNHELWVVFVSNDNNNLVLLCSSSDDGKTWVRRN